MELNKIYNEDCVSFMRTMDSGSVDLIITSPPYNYGGFNRNGRVSKYDSYDDNMPIEDYKVWIGVVLQECSRILKVGGSIYWNHKGKFENYIFKHCFWVIDICPIDLQQHIIWKFPSSPDVAKIRRYPRHEDIFYFSKGKPSCFNEDMSRMTDVWDINHQGLNNDHPAPFPLQLAERCVVASSNQNDVVFDPFMGSGTVAIASIKNKRNYIGTEISKTYISMANDRILPYTSQTSLF